MSQLRSKSGPDDTSCSFLGTARSANLSAYALTYTTRERAFTARQSGFFKSDLRTRIIDMDSIGHGWAPMEPSEGRVTTLEGSYDHWVHFL